MCYNGSYKEKQVCEYEQIFKSYLSSDWSLQLGTMKLKSLVIVDQNATVNTFSGLVHTARRTTGIGSIGSQLSNLQRRTLPKMGSVTGVKS
jgi:hypothetical protein